MGGRVIKFYVAKKGIAYHAGVFRGARISSNPGGRNTSSPKNACVGG